MADKNVVTVEGNLTKAPVYIEQKGRTPVSLLRIACNRRCQNRETGAWESHPRFFNVSVYGPGAEQASTFVKGQKLLVNGYLNSYTKGEGAERREYVTIVSAKTEDGITRVVKAEEQSQGSTASEEASIS